MKLSQIHPFFYYARIYQKRLTRHGLDLIKYQRFAREIRKNDLEFKLNKHQSLLRRKLGSTSPILQENKIVNLGIAIKKVDGIVIKPGEVFSFWRLIGKTTKQKGYIVGLLLSRGEVKKGVGGGLCQLANLLYWMALHTPLEVIERHHHSFDPFPDDRRALPFGSGASVFYNYIDLRFNNPTDQSIQIRVWLTDEHLKGAIYSDNDFSLSFHIEERNHRFLKKDGKKYRENELWRIEIDKKTGKKIKEEFLLSNHSEVKYEIPMDSIIVSSM